MGFFKNLISKLANSLSIDDNLEKNIDKLKSKGYDISSLLNDKDYAETNQKLYNKIEKDMDEIMMTFPEEDSEFDEEDLSESNVESARKEIEQIYSKKLERLDKVIEMVRKKYIQELEGNEQKGLNGILEKIHKEWKFEYEEDKKEDLEPIIAIENRIRNKKREEERRLKIQEEIDKGIVAERLKAINARQNPPVNQSTGARNVAPTPRQVQQQERKSYSQTLSHDITIRQVQENFNEEYPYLRLGFYLVKTGQKADKDGGTICSIDSSSTLREIRSFKGNCKIFISENDSPGSIEKKFRTESGLVVKVCYNDENDQRIYISKGNEDYNKTLWQLNKEFRDKGYQKADIS